MSVLAPKTGIRLPVGSDVAITWPAADALVLGGPSSPQEESAHEPPYDGSSIDLEKELTRYMLERRVSRRQLLEADRQARTGRGRSPRSSRPARPAASGQTPAPTASPAASAAVASAAPPAAPADSAEPTPVPVARRPSSSSTTGPSTSARHVIDEFEEKYGVKVTYDFFSNTDEAYAKLGNDGGGYDVSFPISVDIPALHARRAPSSSSTSRCSRTS